MRPSACPGGVQNLEGRESIAIQGKEYCDGKMYTMLQENGIEN